MMRAASVHSARGLVAVAGLRAVSRNAGDAMAPHHDTILLHGMVFHGRHGVLPEETALGQKFVVDVALGVDLRPAGRSDELHDTVDYSRIYEDVRGVLEGPPCRLLEAVAARVAAVVCVNRQTIAHVEVAIRKPHVAVPGVVDYLGVAIRRSRADALNWAT